MNREVTDWKSANQGTGTESLRLAGMVGGVLLLGVCWGQAARPGEKVVDPGVILDEGPDRDLEEAEGMAGFMAGREEPGERVEPQARPGEIGPEVESGAEQDWEGANQFVWLESGAHGGDEKKREERRAEMAEADRILREKIEAWDARYLETFDEGVAHRDAANRRWMLLKGMNAELRQEVEERSRDIDRICWGQMNVPVGDAGEQREARQDAMRVFRAAHRAWVRYYDEMVRQLEKRNITPGLVEGWKAEQLKQRLAVMGDARWELASEDYFSQLARILPAPSRARHAALRKRWLDTRMDLRTAIQTQGQVFKFLVQENVEFLRDHGKSPLVRETQGIWKAYFVRSREWEENYGGGLLKGWGEPALRSQNAMLADRLVVLSIARMLRTYQAQKTDS